ncbi:MAG TPA: DinB family protein [Longimicrobiaceae bacterium]|nr:DinB family protein [Longimicrobiaceae bacterium]
MTLLSNPFSSARDAAAEYVAELLGILGARDPWEVWEAQPARLAAAVAGLDDAALRVPEAPGKWSVVEVVKHLADTELVYGYRLRRIVAEPGCAVEGYDQDAWARSLGYHDAELPAALEQHRALRTANLRWLRTLDDEQLDRAGVHSERGPESVRQGVRLVAAHDLLHLRQIERIRRAIGAL